MIIPHDEIQRDVYELHKSGGLPRGSLTGWPSLDALYTVGLSQWTLVTGNPHAGKSEFVDALMVNLAKREPWRFYIYSPENWPLAIHHIKIIEKYVGKPFNPGPNARVSEEDIDEAEEWMRDKFFFVKPEQADLVSILIDNATEHVTVSPKEKLGIVVDPWNHLDHARPSHLSETEYVSMSLSAAIKAVRIANMHLWLVAHPTKMQRDRDGKYPMPTPRDVSGSAHWWAKADNCITVHRDQLEGSQRVEIHVLKVRFKHIGHIGSATLLYDRVTGRYNEELKPVKSYANRDQ